jgi:flavodoxin/Pyruvate/2-oxoacid:ferredoxin oxidoreductase delta subunit
VVIILMKSIVIYYSWTGNTKQIAEAIHSGMSKLAKKCDLARLEEVDTKELLNYELIGLGSFVSGAQEPPVVTDFVNGLPSLKGRYGFTFCTHGTCAGGYIARMVKALRKKGLTVTGWNDWYGSAFVPFSPRPYYTDGHPDEVDLKEAKDFGREIVARSQRIAKGEIKLIPRLPRKEKYDRIYGVMPPPQDMPEELGKIMADIGKFRPRLNIQKCKYPQCTICMDYCPTHSINLSASPPISYETCGPCFLWFCEQLCPAGAIEVDWEPIDKVMDFFKSYYSLLAEPMIKYKELRRFRNLSTVEEGSDKPWYKLKKHPRLTIRDGVARLRD